MPDAYTNQAATGFSQTVWSKALIWPYRDENLFDNFASTKSTTEGGTRGKTVTMTYMNDLALATTPIDEIVGPDAVTFTSTTKTFGLLEYANTMKSTALARTTGFVDLDEVLLNEIGQNAAASMDTLAVQALDTSTQVQYANGKAADNLAAGDVLTTKELEIANMELRKRNVPKLGGNYVLVAHPYQVLDLRLEQGARTWSNPRQEGSMGSDELINGYEGNWAGFRIMSSNRGTVKVNASPTGGTAVPVVDHYTAYALGQGGLVKGYSDHPEAPGTTPEIRFGLATDALMRNRPISWYWLGKYDTLRTDAIRKIITAASLANNVS